jgi:hypothetical protein
MTALLLSGALWHNGVVLQNVTRSWQIVVLGIAIVAPTLYCQSQETGGAKRTTTELKLTPAEERDSYEIYSLLLKAESPARENWIISQETTTFPGESSKLCLDPTEDQKPRYTPVIDDYLKRNQKQLTLVRKFDLHSYVLLGRDTGSKRPHFDDPTLFYLSAVGFNSDHTRALVYVGYVCGSLCGSGLYHFMVKKNGQWQQDFDYHGAFCHWQS